VKRPTIADVARKAGVSRSTVSYALSNKRPISEETRQRIQRAIDELGYRPNATAKRLATREVSRNIGFVLPLVAPEITGLELKFIAGASRVINQANYSLVLLAHSDRNDQKLQQFASSGLIDGVILMEVNLHDERVELLQREGIPFVLIGRTADNTGLTYVDTDLLRPWKIASSIYLPKGIPRLLICIKMIRSMALRTGLSMNIRLPVSVITPPYCSSLALYPPQVVKAH
jgi:DNA-binding LacI/PurR family transcriptional regulator